MWSCVTLTEKKKTRGNRLLINKIVRFSFFHCAQFKLTETVKNARSCFKKKQWHRAQKMKFAVFIVALDEAG